MKRTLAFFLASIILLLSFRVTNVSATAAKQDCIVIHSSTYYDDETGSVVTETVTFTPDNQNTSRGASGSGTYRNTKTFTWNGNDSNNQHVMTYFVEGYFVWDDDAGYINVSNVYGNVLNCPAGASISNKTVTTRYGRYFFIFNKYAEIQLSFTTTSVFGVTRDLSVKLRVSENGNVHT